MGSNAVNRDLSYHYMFTQCPNCKTLFRITQEQLDAVAGKVRCGFCYSTFTAYDALYEEIPDLEAAENEEDIEAETTWTDEAGGEEQESQDFAAYVEPASIEPEPPNPFGPAPGAAPTPVFPPALEEPMMSRGERLPPLSIPPLQAALPAPELPPRPVPRETINPTLQGLRMPQPTVPPAASASPPLSAFFSPEAAPALPPIAIPGPERKAEPSATAARQEPSMQQIPNLLDALDSAGRELQQVHRFELDGLRRLRPGLAAENSHLLGWAAATLLMVALLAGQYGYFNRNDLARFPQLRPALETMCNTLGCTLPLMRTPALIRVVSRDIRAHPTEKGALLVRTRILNSAPYVQAFPMLRLELSSVSGEVIASRQFRPEEYLNRAVDISAGIPSQGQVDIELQIVDPSGSAVGFEMSFV